MKHLSKINESDYDDWKRYRSVTEADYWDSQKMDFMKTWQSVGGDISNIKSEDIDALIKHTGLDREKCIEVLKMTKGSLYKAYDYLIKNHGDKIKPGIKPMEKPKKEKKIFNIGDVIIRTKMEQGKLTDDCMEFLRTYKYFKVQEINSNLNIDIGYRTPEGEKYWFSPNNFELKDKPKEQDRPINKKVDPYNEEDWDNEDWKKNNFKNDKFNKLEELKNKKLKTNFGEFTSDMIW
jgi:hypothetical protein